MINKQRSKVKVIPLGGLSEIGKNMTVIEYEDEIIIIDCGLAFPDAEMYGVDLLIPNIEYLLENKEKVKGIFLTHGHEDHIGAIPYVLNEINVPIYGTKFTLALVKSKLEEHNMLDKCILNEVVMDEIKATDKFSVEFVRTSHSIADSCALVIKTPEGIIVHTGDFKIEYNPIDGEIINLQRFAELGKKNVLLLMSDSTNVEQPGYTMSESVIGENLTKLFGDAKGRVIVATFASNIHRVQQIINSSLKYGRKIAFSGRSMEKISSIAIELGYLHLDKSMIVDLDDINKYKSNEITIITTGSQGEPMAALSRIASGTHRKIKVEKDDFIIISASPIPGNKKGISKLINELINKGAEVIYNDIEEIHVSGHACQEELKLMLSLIKPKFFMPVHGEYRHLVLHGELAESLGIDSKRIFKLDIGDVLELTRKSGIKDKKVASGVVMIDGLGIGDIGSIVLRDRKFLSKEGVLIVNVVIDRGGRKIISGPDIITRGFIYVKDSSNLIKESNDIVRNSLEEYLDKGIFDWRTLKGSIRSELSQFLYLKTKRKPIIIPVLIEV